MYIDHLAIWTLDIESLRTFYEHYFDAKVIEKYVNPEREFASYFLCFTEGARIELMQMSGIPNTKNDSIKQFTGYIHFALKLGSETKVDALTERLRKDGVSIVSEPHRTGDGYYESVLLDPDSNRVELVA